MNPIKNVYVVGRGAVGGSFGSLIQDKIGDDFAFICDQKRKERYASTPFLINGQERKIRYVVDEGEKADLILIATKASGFEEAMAQIQPFLKEDTILISCLNGIESDETLMERFKQPVIRAISQKMDAIYRNDAIEYTQTGELVIGKERPEQEEALQRLKAFFDAVHFPYVESQDIVHDQYSKLMLNCGINQVCGVYHATYGDVVSDPHLFDLFLTAMREVQSVVSTYGIDLSNEEVWGWVDAIRNLAPDSMPSMAQDMQANKKTEVELFSGTLIKMAQQKNISVHVLQDLYEKIKAYEDGLQ